jgi:hypothetical protein
MANQLVIVGALFVVAGIAVAGVAVTRQSEGGVSSEVTALVSEIDGEANMLRTTVLDRAGTLGALRQVQIAVATDVETVRDMQERGELGLQLQPGEVIELGTVPQRAAFADRTIFLIQPEGAKRAASDDLLLGASASWLEDCDHQVPQSCATVVYTTVYEVTPAARVDHVAGYLRVSRHLDLGPAVARLVAAGGDARCGERRAAPAGWLALARTPASGFTCFVAMPAAGHQTLPLLLGAGAALAGVVLLVAGIARKRGRSTVIIA